MPILDSEAGKRKQETCAFFKYYAELRLEVVHRISYYWYNKKRNETKEVEKGRKGRKERLYMRLRNIAREPC